MKREHAETIVKAAAACFEPKPTEAAYVWCEQHIVLTEAHGQYPGPLSTDLTPWIREPLECICRDFVVSDIALMFGSQLAKTILFMLAKMYMLVNTPRDILFMMPNATLGGAYSQERWQPMVEACAALLDLKTTNADKYRKMDMHYTAAWLNIVGSNSAANISSRARGVVFQDESDKCAAATEKETSSSKNADKRAKTFANPKRIKASTPTTEYGTISQEFKMGDQCEWEVPCPHCAAYIELIMKQIKWDGGQRVNGIRNLDRVQQSAFYECQNCGGKIADGHKTRMNRYGRWVPRNAEAPAHRRSFHLSSWYAPWPDTTFGRTAVKFLESKDAFDMQDFDTNEVGVPYIVEAKKLEWEVLAARRELSYKLGSIPASVAIITAFCDVQDDRLEWFVWGFGEGMESWVIEHEIMIGDPSMPDVWEALKITILEPRDLRLDWTFIDYGGHHGQQSIEFVKSMTVHRVYLHFGSTDSKCPVNGRKTKTKKPITALYTTGVGNAKRWVLSALKISKIGPAYCHFPGELDEEFFEQLCAEQLVPRKVKGEVIEEWKSVRARNEAWDGFVGCYAAFKRLNKGILKKRFAELYARQKGAAQAVTHESVAAQQSPGPMVEESPMHRSARKRNNPRRNRSGGSWMNS